VFERIHADAGAYVIGYILTADRGRWEKEGCLKSVLTEGLLLAPSPTRWRQLCVDSVRFGLYVNASALPPRPNHRSGSSQPWHLVYIELALH
jgi:hypothetical protein